MGRDDRAAIRVGKFEIRDHVGLPHPGSAPLRLPSPLRGRENAPCASISGAGVDPAPPPWSLPRPMFSPATRTATKDLLTLAWPVILARIGIMTMGLTDAIVVGNFSSRE